MDGWQTPQRKAAGKESPAQRVDEQHKRASKQASKQASKRASDFRGEKVQMEYW
jgi:hypothetical protein